MLPSTAPLAGQAYRYQRFTFSLLLRDMRFQKGTPSPGDVFPAFKLLTTDGDELANEDLLGKAPVLLVFGSMTCPMTASAMPFLKQLQIEFGERVRFIIVNVREAHPGEYYQQPTTMSEKVDHARALKQHYGITWTVAADNVDGSLHRLLDPKPNSAYLVNNDGTIAFRSLWASDRKAMRQALESVVAGRVPRRQQSQALLRPVTRAMGQVQDVMDRAGPQAVKDLWRAGLPMALAGRVATIFSPLAPDQRGISAVLSMAIGMMLVFALVGTSFLR